MCVYCDEVKSTMPMSRQVRAHEVATTERPSSRRTNARSEQAKVLIRWPGFFSMLRLSAEKCIMRELLSCI